MSVTSPLLETAAVGQLLLLGNYVTKRLRSRMLMCWRRCTGLGGVCYSGIEKYNIEKDIATISRRSLTRSTTTWHRGEELLQSRDTPKTKHFIYSYLGQVAVSPVQIWLKAWTVPHSQWSIQNKDCSLNSKHQRLWPSALPSGNNSFILNLYRWFAGYSYNWFVVINQLAKHLNICIYFSIPYSLSSMFFLFKIHSFKRNKSVEYVY